VVQFGLRDGPVKREIPSARFACSGQALSLRLKNGSAQDDTEYRFEVWIQTAPLAIVFAAFNCGGGLARQSRVELHENSVH
jgi:hypothetical protein